MIAIGALVEVNQPGALSGRWRLAYVESFEPYQGSAGFYVTYMDHKERPFFAACGWTSISNIRWPD